MQHCFDFLPLPQGHGEFLPNVFIADLIVQPAVTTEARNHRSATHRGNTTILQIDDASVTGWITYSKPNAERL
jgi:hypothetical protein